MSTTSRTIRAPFDLHRCHPPPLFLKTPVTPGLRHTIRAADVHAMVAKMGGRQGQTERLSHWPITDSAAWSDDITPRDLSLHWLLLPARGDVSSDPPRRLAVGRARPGCCPALFHPGTASWDGPGRGHHRPRPAYLRMLDELVPSALHTVELHVNNPVEADHGRLKARLRPVRGLERCRLARLLATGHSLALNLRLGHYDIATMAPTVIGAASPSTTSPSPTEPTRSTVPLQRTKEGATQQCLSRSACLPCACAMACACSYDTTAAAR